MRISDWSSDVCSSDLSRTTANFPLWATIAPRYASRRVSASRAHSMTGADPTPFQRKGEGRAVGDPLRLDLHQPGRFAAQVGPAIARRAAFLGDDQPIGGVADGKEIGRAHVGPPTTNAK